MDFSESLFKLGGALLFSHVNISVNGASVLFDFLTYSSVIFPRHSIKICFLFSSWSGSFLIMIFSNVLCIISWYTSSGYWLILRITFASDKLFLDQPRYWLYYASYVPVRLLRMFCIWTVLKHYSLEIIQYQWAFGAYEFRWFSPFLCLSNISWNANSPRSFPT